MTGFIIASIFFISILVIVCVAKIKFNKYFKIPLLIICITVFMISGFFEIVFIDACRISHGAELFIKNSIAISDRDSLPPLSDRLTEEEKVRIKDVMEGLPEKVYEIILYDRFGDLWEYHIEYENGNVYFCAVDAPDTYLRLFAKTNYKLYNLRKEKE